MNLYHLLKRIFKDTTTKPVTDLGKNLYFCEIVVVNLTVNKLWEPDWVVILMLTKLLSWLPAGYEEVWY
jgi:hypothetical protein